MEPPFVLLKFTSWLPVEEMNTLLGAVVKNFWAPTDNFMPADPLVYNKGRKFVEKSYNDFVLSNVDGAGKAAKLKLQGLTSLSYKGEVDDSFDLRGKHIRYVKLRQVDIFWKNLKEDPEIMSNLSSWIGTWRLSSRPPVCLITGMFICEDVVLKSSAEDSQGRQMGIEAPVGTTAAALGASHGVFLPIDGVGNFEANLSVDKVQRRNIVTKDQGCSIFALQLKVISSKIFDKGQLILKDKSPGIPAHRQMGEDDELPSIDSLSLEDLDEQFWTDWEKLDKKT